jgi:hypothetical protein
MLYFNCAISQNFVISSTKPIVNKLLVDNKAKLTYNAIEHMLAYINIDYINNIIKGLAAYINKGTKDKFKYIREDVRPMFNNLIDSAKELVNIMHKSKVVLSRS